MLQSIPLVLKGKAVKTSANISITMGMRPAEVSVPEMVELLHQAIQLEGLPAGFQVPADDWDLIMMDGMGIGAEKSIRTYTRIGELKRLWHRVEAHGRGGRGYVIFDPIKDAAPPATA